jgi:hypothetical protein
LLGISPKRFWFGGPGRAMRPPYRDPVLLVRVVASTPPPSKEARANDPRTTTWEPRSGRRTRRSRGSSRGW